MKISRSTMVLSLALVLGALLALAACSPAATPTTAPPALPTAAPAPTSAPAATTAPAAGAAQATALKLSQTGALGSFLSDGNGRTLYIYARDTKDTPTCYDACAKNWPPFVTQGKSSPLEGVDASLIGTATRKEGTTQATYNGWPLYYWNADSKSGDTFGYGIGNVWWVIRTGGDAVTAAPAPAVTINLAAGKDADQSGTVRLTAKGDKTDVALTVKPGAAGVEQPARIYEGGCPASGAAKFTLSNVVDGKSTTSVDASFTSLLSGGFSVTVHKSASELTSSVACGAIPQGVLLKIGPGRDADQSGSAVLLAQGNKTEVDLFIKPTPPLVEPAHIHEGPCPGVGAVKFPLTNVEFGSSKTVVDAPLADLLKGGYSINAHKSANDMAVYVACGGISSGA